jgi:hypothetical protein
MAYGGAVAIMPVSRVDRWRPAPAVRPVVPVAPPPRAARAGRHPLDEPMDVDVLWEEFEAVRPPAPAALEPLPPTPASVAHAYAQATRRPPRPLLVDVAVP